MSSPKASTQTRRRVSWYWCGGMGSSSSASADWRLRISRRVLRDCRLLWKAVVLEGGGLAVQELEQAVSTNDFHEGGGDVYFFREGGFEESSLGVFFEDAAGIAVEGLLGDAFFGEVEHFVNFHEGVIAAGD